MEGGVEIRTLPTRVTTYPGDITDNIVYQLPDNLGSVNLRLNTSGTIIDKEEYYPFGDTSLRTFTYKRYRYVGKEKDSESGLYYYGARYYAAWTCRFISVDPLAAEYAYLTPYNYAGNKPINSIDIDGVQAQNETKSETNSGSDGGDTSYTVKKGDSLSKIAQIHGTTVKDILDNPINQLYFSDQNRKIASDGTTYIYP